MEEREIEYGTGSVPFVGRLVTDGGRAPRPGVLVAHDWAGRNDLAFSAATRLAKLGYAAFAIDLYGGAQVLPPEQRPVKMAELNRDRSIAMGRMNEALSTLRSQVEVDVSRTAAIGFCYGGQCVLDLARSGADVGGVVSFHGLLKPAPAELCRPITAQVLALHGYQDPMARPADLAAFEAEMLAGGADFQVHVYGRAVHAFANPIANNPAFGTVYDALTAQRAYRAMENFLSDLFHGAP